MQGVSNSKGACRLIQEVRVRPHACYRFSCWVKARDLKSADFKLLAMGTSAGGRSLTFHEGRLPTTQDWRQIEVVFNSLNEKAVTLLVGIWSDFSGTLWIDDLSLEELSLVNVLRREGCPLNVASEDGKTVYAEGKDYLPVRDPKMGAEGGSPFNFHHAGATIQLTETSAIKEGEPARELVSPRLHKRIPGDLLPERPQG